MKKLFIIFLFIYSGHLYAQKLPDFGFDKVHIIKTDRIIQAEIKPMDSPPKVKSDKYYTWYSANDIHSTQGGFSGQLLNGSYTEYYLNRNLREQGNFKRGVKDGEWKSWNEDGSLINESLWKDGKLIPSDSTTLWDKLNFFKRKSSRPDTASKPKPN